MNKTGYMVMMASCVGIMAFCFLTDVGKGVKYIHLSTIFSGILGGNEKEDLENITNNLKEASTAVSGNYISAEELDTFRVRVDKENRTVHLIGIEPLEDVSVLDEKLQKGDTLYLEYDEEKETADGDLQAYLYFSDGEMVQMWLIENNYAKAVSEPPNTKHDDLLSESEENNGHFWLLTGWIYWLFNRSSNLLHSAF